VGLPLISAGPDLDAASRAFGFRCGAHADPGVRTHQEDAFLVDPALGLFAVADGMGAMASARHAADLALETLRDLVARASSGTAEERLASAVQGANEAVWSRADAAARDWRERSSGADRPYDHAIARWHGAGATVVALLFGQDRLETPPPNASGTGEGAPKTATLAHAGDSRAYRLRRWHLEPLTEDHRLRADARRAGMSEAEIAELPDKVITAALGIQANATATVSCVGVEPGDLFLLCSDGLSDAASREEIELILLAHLDDLGAGARALVARAIAPSPADPATDALGDARGDNVTVLLVRAAR
jgi:protein phosphatase